MSAPKITQIWGSIMVSTAKVLVLNDHAYVSPYLMRPLRRLDEVERAQSSGDTANAEDSKPPQRQSAGLVGRAARATEAGRR